MLLEHVQTIPVDIYKGGLGGQAGWDLARPLFSNQLIKHFFGTAGSNTPWLEHLKSAGAIPWLGGS